MPANEASHDQVIPTVLVVDDDSKNLLALESVLESASFRLIKAQTGYRLLNDLKIVLPILALVLLGLGVYVARSHRRALIGRKSWSTWLGSR